MIAYIFPGQGAQFVGMGKDLLEKFPCSRQIFERADAALGFSISSLCFQGPQEQLTITENAQPAILTVSVAALEVLKASPKGAQRKPAFVAGLSLGEYSALVASGVLSFEDAVILVRKRGIYMEEAARHNPGKMLSIIGLSQEAVREICQATGCEIANLNCPGQIVVSGKNDQSEEAMRLAQEKGAKRALFLEVSGAFHSSLMKEAEEKLATEMSHLAFHEPTIPLVSNVTARSANNKNEILKNLIKQVSSSTFWEDSVRFMAEKGVDCFLEIGPGNVLRGLNRRIDAALTTVSIGTAEQLQTFISKG